MSSLQSDILALSVAYALIGALLLVVLVYARLPWPVKAVAVVVTSSFYIASFLGMRGLLGWASVDKLPASFKLLQARIVEPHSLEGDPGTIYLWVEALDEGNRPSGVPRAYRIPYSDRLAEKTAVRFTLDAEGKVIDVEQRQKSLLETFRSAWRNGADIDPKTGVRMRQP